MFRFSVILFALWGGFGTTSAVPMDGGTVITKHEWYSHLVAIRKGADSTGTFECLGVVLSSQLIYTSNYCGVTQANMNDYVVDASFSNSDPETSLGKVVYVYEGKHMNDFKQLTLQMPGLQIALVNPGPNDTTAAPGNSSKGIRASPFFDGGGVDFASLTWLVMAYDGKEFKAGVVKISPNETECSELYMAAKKSNMKMPVNKTDELLCAMKADSKTEYSLFGADMDVEPATPCDDSLGSPLMGPSLTMGIVVKAFCDAALKVAFIQPIVLPDTGLKADNPGLPEPETESQTPDVYTGTVMPVTGLSPRSPRTRPVNEPVIPPQPNLANEIINQLTVWSIVVVLGNISAV